MFEFVISFYFVFCFASCLVVVAAFWVVHGLHLNKPLAIYMCVCVWKCWCVLA